MLSYAKNLAEYFRQSRNFYYLILDSSGSFSYANPFFRECFGHLSTDVTKMSLVFSPRDADNFTMAARQCLNDPYSVVTVETATESQGSVISILWEISALTDQGKPESMQAIGVNSCSEKPVRQAKYSFRKRKDSFLHIVNNPRFGVVMRNVKGKILFYNKTALDFSGLSEDDFLKTTLPVENVSFIKEDGSALPPDQHPTMIAIRSKIPVKDTVLGVQKRNDTEYHWLLINAEPVKNDKNELLHVITTFIDITERKKVEQKLITEEINQQKIITRATIEGQEKERKEIGKELHDNINQLLTTTLLYLEIAKQTADSNTFEMIQSSSKFVSNAIDEIRKLSRSLAPPSLGDLGLLESIEDLCDSIRTTHLFAVSFYHSGIDENTLNEDVKFMLFRIIQEQIKNIIMHAKASSIGIRLTANADRVTLVISDNGKGFNPLTTRRGLGLNNIINRAEVFNGKAEINSAPNQGCTVSVTLPV
jgi:PAS domain S-box-containing protein